MTDETRSSRRAWAASVVLGFPAGLTHYASLVMAITKAEALSIVIQEAAKLLPETIGENYSIVSSHATLLHPDVIRAAADEITPTNAG